MAWLWTARKVGCNYVELMYRRLVRIAALAVALLTTGAALADYIEPILDLLHDWQADIDAVCDALAGSAPVYKPGEIAIQVFRKAGDNPLKTAVAGVAGELPGQALAQRQQLLRLAFGDWSLGERDKVDITPAGPEIVHDDAAVQPEAVQALVQDPGDFGSHPADGLGQHYLPSGKLVKHPRSTCGRPYFSFASAMARIMKAIFRARLRMVCRPSRSFFTSSAVKPCTWFQ